MTGRVIAITGASGVLGSALARAAADQGYRVALIDHAPVTPPDLVAACGAGVVDLPGTDLTSSEAAASAIARLIAATGRLDVLVNVAGGFVWQTTEAGDLATWDRLHALNLKTALNTCRAALPHLKASPDGRIINIGANAALKSASGMGAYGASKAGVHRLTEGLAEELKSSRVTVNAVLPSIIDTPANRADMPDADFSAWVAPSDLASVILYLASPEARAVTGALIPVTGRV